MTLLRWYDRLFDGMAGQPWACALFTLYWVALIAAVITWTLELGGVI